MRTSTAPSSAMAMSSTMPRSVIGRRISGSLTPARAAVICSGFGAFILLAYGPGRARLSAAGAGPRGGALVAVGIVRRAVELVQQRAQLRPHVVAGGDLAESHPQRRHLPGEELHVGVCPAVVLAVTLGDHPVAVLLPVL